MNFKIYNTLPKEALNIRETVFVEEQGFHDEFDIIDSYAKHLVLYNNKKPIATCRFFKDKSCADYVIGRIAVIKQYRGQNLGLRLLKITESEIDKLDGKRIVLHAQVNAQKFYEKLGYSSYGEVDFEENCPHIWMYKNIGGEK